MRKILRGYGHVQDKPDKKIKRGTESYSETEDDKESEERFYQDRNEFFMDNIYNEFRTIFRSWGYKFARSVEMTPDEAEMEAVRIALEQTHIRMHDIHDMSIVHILHATKQRMINLCNRNAAQKRNNYYFKKGYFCECGRELDSEGKCTCGKWVEEGVQKRKKYNVSLDDMKDGANEDSFGEDCSGYNYSVEYIKAPTIQEDSIYLQEFMNELRGEMDWRFKTGKVTSNVITIYQLLVEDGLDYQDICKLMGMEDSTFYLYRSRIMECYFAVKNRLDRKFAVKKKNKK